MQMDINREEINNIQYLNGSSDMIEQLKLVQAKTPFDERIVCFLNDVSKELMSNPMSRHYSDVMTFGFWIRKSSIYRMKERFTNNYNTQHLGRGVVLHFAPSNVPINFAYSLVAGLLNGNANIVRVPSKEFPQVKIITDAFEKVLTHYEDLEPYIICVRYERNKKINDIFSMLADVRIIWGGDKTIDEIRKSPIPPSSFDITFSDRYSFAIIDSDSYMNIENKKKVAEDFYNDTFLTDQNACSSPRIIVWMGNRIEEAKKVFWAEEKIIVEDKYNFQAIQGVNKLKLCYLVAVGQKNVRIEDSDDNLIKRISLSEITDDIMDYRGNCGLFYEYDCTDIMSIKALCDNKRCQTVAYIGNEEILRPIIESGIKGISRVVPMGKTMDFDLIWDGYNLSSYLSRSIVFLK